MERLSLVPTSSLLNFVYWGEVVGVYEASLPWVMMNQTQSCLQKGVEAVLSNLVVQLIHSCTRERKSSLVTPTIGSIQRHGVQCGVRNYMYL